MSVLIKGMDKPDYCDVCPYAFCHLDTNNCPIVAIPDHGDLIDRDAYLDKLRTVEDDGVWMYAAAASVSVMPAVIPAERSKSPCDDCDYRSDVGCSWCRRFERSRK